jgi:hypothetical protein
MLVRALVVWIVLLVTAIANGAVRELAFVPRIGEAAGHVLSTLTLCAAISCCRGSRSAGFAPYLRAMRGLSAASGCP